MQLLAAQARDPGFRPELADKLAAVGPMISGQVDANAGAVFSRALHALLTGGDTRFTEVPAGADIAATHAADLPALLRPAFAGPADVVVVGDVTVDAAIRAMSATFGAGPVLPPRAEQVPHPALPAPSAVPHVAFHQGRADQAYYGEYWLLPDYFTDPHGSYVARVAAGVLQARLIDTVREKLGLTYTPMTDTAASVQLAGLGYLGAVLETPPANFPTFRALLDAQLADLAAHPVSADEFERARRPLIAGRIKDMEGNGFWPSCTRSRAVRPSAPPISITACAISSLIRSRKCTKSSKKRRWPPISPSSSASPCRRAARLAHLRANSAARQRQA
jgi:zinc protease